LERRRDRSDQLEAGPVIVQDGVRRVIDPRVRQQDVEPDLGEPSQAVDHLRPAVLDGEGQATGAVVPNPVAPE
jgi:hypothetical protein